MDDRLLTNPEVLAVNQDALVRPARRQFGSMVEIWTKELSCGALAIGFFNRTSQPQTVEYDWQQAGRSKPPRVRDLWLRKDLPKSGKFTAENPPHGCAVAGEISRIRY